MTDGSGAQTAQQAEEKSTASENSGQPSNSQSQPRMTENQQVDAIAQMMADGRTDDSSADNAANAGSMDAGHSDGNSGVPDPEPLTPKGLAEKLDIDPETLYSMQVTVGDSQVTLGDLKDSFATREATAAETREQLDAIRNREAGLVGDIQALGVLDAMQQLPKNLRDQANSHLVKMAEREYSKFLTLYPEYQIEVNRIAFEKDMNDWMGSYGLSAGMFPVRNVAMYQLIRDAVNARRELAEIKAPKAKKAPKSSKPQRRKSDAPKAQRPRSGGHIQGQVNDIAALMAKGSRR